MALFVQKYGGMSLATPEKISLVAKRIAQLHQQNHQAIVVVSAMGNTTNELTQMAYAISPFPVRRELDMLLSTGERVSMALLSLALNHLGCPAISFTGSQAGILTDQAHSNARVVSVKPTRVQEEINKNRVVVLAGFQGVCPETKEITTLGRGGSDTTAVAMASYFKPQYCEILKEVHGVYSADPKIVPQARHLSRLNYQQFLDMTFWGAKVQYYRSVELAARQNVRLRIAHAHEDGPSTIIEAGDSMDFHGDQVLSINSHKQVLELRTQKNSLPQFLSGFNQLLDSNDLPWPQILHAEHNGDHWHVLVTGSEDAIECLQKIKQNIFTINSEKLSTITATLSSSFNSSHPQTLSQALDQAKIQHFHMLVGPLSLTFTVKAAECHKAITTLNQIVGK